MQELYEVRFRDKPAGNLPLLTGVAEKHYAAGAAVRLAAGGEYRLLVSLQGGLGNANGENCLLLSPGQTVLTFFAENTVLCEISFRCDDIDRLFRFSGADKAIRFSVTEPKYIAEAAAKACRVPDGCTAALYRSALLLQIFSRFPINEEEENTDDCGKRAMQYIRENYMRPITVNDVASAVGVSRSWLYRRFMDYAAQSPAMYLRDVRMLRAQSLLQHTDMPVQDVAFAVGYEDALYFSRAFSAYTGCPPRSYRKQHGG